MEHVVRAGADDKTCFTKFDEFMADFRVNVTVSVAICFGREVKIQSRHVTPAKC